VDCHAIVGYGVLVPPYQRLHRIPGIGQTGIVHHGRRPPRDHRVGRQQVGDRRRAPQSMSDLYRGVDVHALEQPPPRTAAQLVRRQQAGVEHLPGQKVPAA
jgi:hypothetical protein